MISYAFLLLALWPLVCCAEACRYGPACITISVLVAVVAFAGSQLVRELWLLRILRGHE